MNDGSGNSPDKRRNLYYTSSGLIDAQNNPSVPALAVVQDGLANPIEYQPWSYFKGLTWAYTDAWERHVYAHLFPPNTPPINTYHNNTFRCQEGDQRHVPDEQSPRRRQRLVHGRLGPLHQELGQPSTVVVHGHSGPG